MFNFQEQLEIVSKYKQGKDTYMLAKEYSCGKETIRRILIKHKVPRRGQGKGKSNYTPVTRRMIIEDWNTNKKVGRICFLYKIRKKTLYSMLSHWRSKGDRIVRRY